MGMIKKNKKKKINNKNNNYLTLAGVPSLFRFPLSRSGNAAKGGQQLSCGQKPASALI
jgi:hypothetical protein